MAKRKTKISSLGFTKLHNYLVGDKVGGGEFSEINTALHSETFHPVVIKSLMKRKILSLSYGNELIFSETAIAPLLIHPNITPMIELIETESQIIQVLEYMDNGNLYSFMTSHNIPLKEKVRIADEILAGVEYLHMRNICHRDIKLDNVLINGNITAKLCDFGFATFANDYLTGSYGSYGYAAPEVFVDAPYDGKKADMFSVGVLLYALFGERMPFEDTQNPDFSALDFTILPDGIDEIVRDLLVFDPQSRISASAARQHSIFQDLPRRTENHEPEIIFPVKRPHNLVLRRIAETMNSTMEDTLEKLKESHEMNIQHYLYILFKELLELEGYEVDNHQNCGTYPSLPCAPLSKFQTIEDMKCSESYIIKEDPSTVLLAIDNYMLKKNYSISKSVSGKRTAVFMKKDEQIVLNYDSSPCCESSCTDITLTSKNGIEESDFIALCGFLKEHYCTD
ncbi:CAMK family protein kinase [Tritrichomonas foetus]|uniref:CAMK family protein kinase n=1 Tax=Tritrichomonas foetus TaxID=1144522 RepID=A0A1J4L1X3_9EUKA|nr:CAMK family protein kinase [Tritrichomonas foetus]|eukprot:OHT17513.1 CAMK family protein kinase [Tritrichomonas foetus]